MSRLRVAALLGALTAAGCASSDAGPAQRPTFTNPVISSDFADPDVVEGPDGWYAYATGVPGHSAIQVARSADLVTWSEPEDALPQRPDWQPLQDGLTWAPDVVPVDDGWRMYYVARHQGSGLQCLSTARADDPGGPFVDDSEGPFLCQEDLGGSIDPEVFRDEDGRTYLFWKNDGNAVGADTRIWVCELGDDGVSLVGTPLDTGLVQTHPWQGALVEAPAVVAVEDGYVMFYSANDYGSEHYAMGYATASSVTGPWTDRSPQPWVASAGPAAGPGGQTVVRVGGQTWLAYHAWDAGAVGYPAGRRAMWLDRIDWRDGEPVLRGPTATEQPVPGSD
ncbi:MAG: glycoside hydrolase family 43 protein [Actinomycetes bacterium]